jgi:hypothetical protein
MSQLNFSLVGLLDIIFGVLLYFTISPLPAVVATIHAAFLIYKGSATIVPLPLGMPGFILGSAADLMSAAIIVTGTPPLLGGYKLWIAAFLFIKGIQGFLFMM